MNKKLTIYSMGVLALAWFYPSFATKNTIEETRKANFQYDISNQVLIDVQGSDTQIEIESWNKNEVSIEATITYRGKERADMLEFLDNFKQHVQQNITFTSKLLQINSNLKTPNKIQIGKRNAGLIVSYNIDELILKYTIKVPVENKLKVKSSYKKLEMTGSYNAPVSIEHYSGDFYGGSFDEVELDMKYGNSEFDKINKLNANTYEQNIRIGRLNEGVFEAKYSKVKINYVEMLDLLTYESKISLSNVNEIRGEMKYSHLEVTEQANSIILTYNYETDIAIGHINHLQLNKSKYGEYRIGSVNHLIMRDAYEDDVFASRMTTGDITAKYANIEINNLRDSFILDGYETTSILTLSETTNQVKSTGKYGRLLINTNKIPYSLDAQLQYGKIDYVENSVKQTYYLKDSDRLNVKLLPANGANIFCQVNVTGYEMKVDMK